jgi:hypothetical protein
MDILGRVLRRLTSLALRQAPAKLSKAFDIARQGG